MMINTSSTFIFLVVGLYTLFSLAKSYQCYRNQDYDKAITWGYCLILVNVAYIVVGQVFVAVYQTWLEMQLR